MIGFMCVGYIAREFCHNSPMVPDGCVKSGSTRMTELDAKSWQIASNLISETPKLSETIRHTISLLENFKFQVSKLQQLEYCDHELAYVSFNVSLRLISKIQRRSETFLQNFVGQILSTLESQKDNYESIKALVIQENDTGLVSLADVLLKRFASLQPGVADYPLKSNLQGLRSSDSISSQHLNQLIRRYPDRILLLDFRSQKEFSYSHINFLNVVNIEPAVIKRLFDTNSDPSDMDLEQFLSERIEDVQLESFKKRFKFDLVVLYNLRFGGISNDKFDSLEYSLIHGDNNGFPSLSPFKQLINLLVFKNKYISSRLKQYPVYIRGGLERWYQAFGESALTSESFRAKSSAGQVRASEVELLGSEVSKSAYLRNFGEYLATAKSVKVGLPPSSLRNDTYVRNTDLALRLVQLNATDISDPAIEKTPANGRCEAERIVPRLKPSATEINVISDSAHAQTQKEVNSPDLIQLFATGLTNLGNSCYMNCILQCLSSTPELTNFFFPVLEVGNIQVLQTYKQHINMDNNLGSKGVITTSFVKLLGNMFNNSGKYFSPSSFKQTVGSLSPGGQFATSDQQDCIEFLNFILDALHEDLNQRVINNAEEKAAIMELSPDQEKAREFMPVRLASTIEWERYLKLNFSVIVDYFQGQYLSQLRCIECKSSSTTYNSFSILSLPIPEKLSGSAKVTLSQCLDLFTETELLDDDNKWHCPRCQRFTKLTKKITITRLPRILIIHLKRFNMHSNGYFRKLDTFVTYPVDEVLDLTTYWPSVDTYVNENTALMITSDREREILASFPDRNQDPPFRYQLYGVVNHFGNLSTGHYTAFVRKGYRSKTMKSWCYFDDAKVQFDCKESQVLNKNAYCLFYLRVS